MIRGSLVPPIRARHLIALLFAAACHASDTPAADTLPFAEVVRATDASDTRLIAALRGFIPTVIRAHGTPGLNLAVARRGKIIWEAGYGYANLDTRQPMTPDIAFHSGSMGKTYTATAIMQLVEQGVLQLDAPINRYLKVFQVTNRLGDRPVTIRDLLTHHSGIGENGATTSFAPPPPLEEHLKRAYADSMLEMYDGHTGRLWIAKVGKEFHYSNLGFATLGYLVQVTNPEKLTYSDYIQKHIIDPLGMTGTRFPPIQDSVHLGAEIWNRLSRGYTSIGQLQIPTPTADFADYPAGTLVSTPGQHIKLILAYLGGGSYNGYRLLQPKTVATMLAPQAEAFPGISLGLTWMLFDVGHPADSSARLRNPRMSFGHGGAHMYGWINDYRAWPGLDVAVAVATNHWRLPNDAIDRESSAIEDFIVSWLRTDYTLPEPDRTLPSWAWKTSYVAGLLYADQLTGQLGNPDPLTDGMIDAMISGARVGTAAPGKEAGWDPEGFRAGIRDMLKLGQNPDSIRAYAASGRFQVTAAELDRIGKELGSSSIPLLAGPLQ
jgi:CubicO group peptidase (beta-lactamase class C family)